MKITITSKEIEILDKLLNPWERVSIQTDEDLVALGEIFDEEE
jgi:hypothetical protein